MCCGAERKRRLRRPVGNGRRHRPAERRAAARPRAEPDARVQQSRKPAPTRSRPTATSSWPSSRRSLLPSKPVEAQYVQFLACAGQKAAGVLGYSPLPPNLVQADFAAVGRITGTPLPAPTAANCPDPYITGSFNGGGASSGPTITGTTTAAAGSTATASGGAAVNPVATTSSAGVAAANTSSGGSSGSGSGSGSGSSSGNGGSSTTSSAAKAAVAAAAAAAKRKAAEAVHAAPGQIPGEAMTQYSNKFLGLPGPSVIVVISTPNFLGAPGRASNRGVLAATCAQGGGSVGR